jgi:sec-independent protein translocase protein TatA
MGLDNPLHIAFLLVILLLIFGAKRLPELGRSLGSGMRGFKETISGEGPTSAHVEQLSATSPEPASPVAAAEPDAAPTHVRPVA